MFQAGITAKAERAEPGRMSSPGGAGMPGWGSQQRDQVAQAGS